jgi:hypothetical protein
MLRVYIDLKKKNPDDLFVASAREKHQSHGGHAPLMEWKGGRPSPSLTCGMYTEVRTGDCFAGWFRKDVTSGSSGFDQKCTFHL